VNDCRTCTLVARRDRGEAPSWDQILRTDHWDLVHAYDTSLPGWLVLVARRHITSLAEMTDGEASELGQLVQRTSRALAEAIGCAKTYAVQFAEHPDHPHVHVHVISRPADLAEPHRGPGVFALLGVPESEQVSEPEMDRIAEAVRTLMT
jgi:diadenosine tetraphosphate (Ap4A) HIT family hydrolase